MWKTYGTLKLGSLATPTFHNIVQTNLGIAQVFTLGSAGYRTRSSISTAVPIHAIAVVVCEATVGA